MTRVIPALSMKMRADCRARPSRDDRTHARKQRMTTENVRTHTAFEADLKGQIMCDQILSNQIRVTGNQSK